MNQRKNLKCICIAGILLGLFFVGQVHASEALDAFTEKYQGLAPPPSSSAHSDYLFEQISLGSEYTIRLLDQIHDGQDGLSRKADEMMDKFDVLIEQNRRIIELLEILSSQEKK